MYGTLNECFSAFKLFYADYITEHLYTLQELMTRQIEQPHDPYIMLTSDHWPAYTELMLRCGVAQRHPSDDKRIKVTPFHL